MAGPVRQSPLGVLRGRRGCVVLRVANGTRRTGARLMAVARAPAVEADDAAAPAGGLHRQGAARSGRGRRRHVGRRRRVRGPGDHAGVRPTERQDERCEDTANRGHGLGLSNLHDLSSALSRLRAGNCVVGLGIWRRGCGRGVLWIAGHGRRMWARRRLAVLNTSAVEADKTGRAGQSEGTVVDR